MLLKIRTSDAVSAIPSDVEMTWNYAIILEYAHFIVCNSLHNSVYVGYGCSIETGACSILSQYRTVRPKRGVNQFRLNIARAGAWASVHYMRECV